MPFGIRTIWVVHPNVIFVEKRSPEKISLEYVLNWTNVWSFSKSQQKNGLDSLASGVGDNESFKISDTFMQPIHGNQYVSAMCTLVHPQRAGSFLESIPNVA